MSDIDLIDGPYRKVYSGFIRGKRINAVSMEAEAFFWRLNMLADDYGNLRADHEFFPGDVGGRRRFTTKQIDGWLSELESVGLIRIYTADGDRHVSIDGFTVRQTTRNGRRARRFTPPGDSGCGRGIPGKVGNPGEGGESGAITSDQTKPDQTTSTSADAVAAVASLRQKPWNLTKAESERLVKTYGAAVVAVAMSKAKGGKSPSGLLHHVLREGIDPEDIPSPAPPAMEFASDDERRELCQAFRDATPGWSDKTDTFLVTTKTFRAWVEKRRTA